MVKVTKTIYYEIPNRDYEKLEKEYQEVFEREMTEDDFLTDIISDDYFDIFIVDEDAEITDRGYK